MHPDKLFNTSDTCTASLLLERLITLKLQRFPIDMGILPSSLLYERSRMVTEVRFPTLLEIAPWNWLWPRLSDSKWLQLYRLTGMVELKLFSDKSRSRRLVMFQRELGSGPSNPF
ncbi:hypothetical protein LOK49_LG15G01796 [Camellia lanceoleosa]|uniref:Uncharacterized protein n=1 Tax=Camellia lanceoleosa TaxID=1840588 RepID=A0ACC0F5P9_9ERIC|nr:hypothetical protein LOK49_LG15G01796 [Camellia lanceoleosa]